MMRTTLNCLRNASSAGLLWYFFVTIWNTRNSGVMTFKVIPNALSQEYDYEDISKSFRTESITK
jgi:hypothetical protein